MTHSPDTKRKQKKHPFKALGIWCLLAYGHTAVAQAAPYTADALSERLLPQKHETMTYPNTYFALGAFREMLANQTKDNYNTPNLGMMIGFYQHIRGIWSGGLEARWSDWKSKDPNTIADTSPLLLASKVAATPHISKFLPHFFSENIRIYATAGLGYTIFFDNRSLLAGRSKTAFGQVAATYGGGLQFLVSPSFGWKLGAEQWRGIQTSDYFSNTLFLELTFGDLT